MVISIEKRLQIITAYDNVFVELKSSVYEKEPNSSGVYLKENQSTVDMETDSNPFFDDSEGSQNSDLKLRAIVRCEIASYQCSRY